MSFQILVSKWILRNDGLFAPFIIDWFGTLFGWRVLLFQSLSPVPEHSTYIWRSIVWKKSYSESMYKNRFKMTAETILFYLRYFWPGFWLTKLTEASRHHPIIICFVSCSVCGDCFLFGLSTNLRFVNCVYWL